MIIKKFGKYDVRNEPVTNEALFHQRRKIIKMMGVGSALMAGSASSKAGILDNILGGGNSNAFVRQPLNYQKGKKISEPLTPEKKVISYNNFYEFGTSKSDPYEHAQAFQVNPWQVTIDGEANNAFTLGYDDLFRRFQLEERIYRLRCVEAWSMVVPWVGFELNQLIKMADPKSTAKYVSFTTLADKEQMRGVRTPLLGGGIDYPYREGLRLDEAMHPLTLIAVGVYGKTLPPQNGAPLRLVVPWKYGFKSVKSIVKISLTKTQPVTTWNTLAANEYGFYANVNPEVDHPRWSQKKERRITEGGVFDQQRIDTRLFNGYDKDVAHLYQGMDLAKLY
ncbi:protein-methionine-sulfoxide reductase catalytic subunit MsrP [Teredinibacter sp. KSP-S5-2]|uniref:protein-methionine-sulfoxide reductase catalytic subunit MsrP n=1 Tax=Teredinibacter sp. KSP-S5-2 TaxID=3034506 RepID=UPI0029349480|nr:protein-methionine-sulfoxide reductase catalytic subunit MsrP [Teredinibacter sp. KSP-S5-2]WNO08415.1 protein-methionine-sulfoxide reductase catalytic subunit MsrP [Teredinibacter sp. KSP-S5-2]